MPVYPLIPTPLNKKILSCNNTEVNNHNSNGTNSTSDVSRDNRTQVVTTIIPKSEVTTKIKDIPSGVDLKYRFHDTAGDTKTKAIRPTTNENLETGKSNTLDTLTKFTEVGKGYVSSIDTTNKLQRVVSDIIKGNELEISQPRTEDGMSKTINKFVIGNVKEERLPTATTGNKVKDFFDNILHRDSNLAQPTDTTIPAYSNKLSIVNQEGIRAVEDKANGIGNLWKHIKSTAAQIRLISKAIETDTNTKNKRKENVSIVLHPKESALNKIDIHKDIGDIFHKVPFVSKDEHGMKKVNSSKLQLNNTDLPSILFPTFELDSQKLIFINGNNNKDQKTEGNAKGVSASKSLYIDIKPVETRSNLQEHTPVHDVQDEVAEIARTRKKNVGRRKKNKEKLPEVTFSSFIPILKPKRTHNQRKKNKVIERHSVSNTDVDVKVFDITNRESPHNIQNTIKEDAQNLNFNTKQNLLENSKISTSDLKENLEIKSQIVNSSEGKKLVMFKPEKVSMCNVYEDFMEKLTMTVLVPYHVYKLTNS